MKKWVRLLNIVRKIIHSKFTLLIDWLTFSASVIDLELLTLILLSMNVKWENKKVHENIKYCKKDHI